MSALRILLAGESWVSSSTHYKGWDFFSSTVYETGIHYLSQALQKAGIDSFEYTPLEVKQAVAGYGGADKKQVQEMVRVLLQLDKIPKPDDAADALAIAITHLNTKRY